MKPSILGAAAALLLAISLAPAALAADDEAAPDGDPVPVVEPTATPVENGEIVIDPTFVIASPTPAGDVRAATGPPQPTPPATDTIQSATTPGTGLQVLLVLGVAGSSLALALGRAPARRRR